MKEKIRLINYIISTGGSATTKLFKLKITATDNLENNFEITLFIELK